MKANNSNSERARVKRPERLQIEWRPMALDQLLPPDHRARLVWAYVESLDLSYLYGQIRAVEGHVGRDAVDPKILMALWLFATIEGISSARHLERLCERDLAYMWICGDVGVNYHLLSDFRSEHGDFLDQLLTNTVATLLHQGLVNLDVVAQDGIRIRANAGTSSFRRRKTLEHCRQEAEKHVKRLRNESEQEGQTSSSENRRKAAVKRAAEEREQQVKKALEEVEQLQKQKDQRKKSTSEARASTTDPHARKMKMADGGYRPAYNVQFATDGETRIIAGVDVTNSGSDRGQMAPMHESLVENYGKIPLNYLVDCGFATKEDITVVEKRGSRVHAPIYGEEQIRKKGNDPYARRKTDSDEMFAFRQRMATVEAQELYRQRPSIAEFPNAECRNRGMNQFRVRGLKKVKTVALWYAISFNLLRFINLGWVGSPR